MTGVFKYDDVIRVLMDTFNEIHEDLTSVITHEANISLLNSVVNRLMDVKIHSVKLTGD